MAEDTYLMSDAWAAARRVGLLQQEVRRQVKEGALQA